MQDLRTFAAALLALLVVIATPGATAEAAPVQDSTERWYTLEMFGGKSGYMRTVETVTDQTVTTESDVTMAVKRGALQLDITMKSRFVETPDGKPISMRSEQTLAGPTITRDYTFKEDGIELVTTQNGRESTTTLPLPQGAWLTPAAAERMLRQRLASGAEEITMRVMDPNSGADPVATTRKVVGRENLTVLGREVEVTQLRVTIASMPGVVSSEYVDAEATLVRSQTNMGGIAVNITAATELEARGEIVAPEVMVSTFVKPDRPIDRPRTATLGVYLLKVPDEPIPDVAATGSQRFEVAGVNAVRVVVDTSFPHAAPPEEAENPAYLAASAMIDCADPAIIKLAEAAARSPQELAPAETAERLRRAVYRHIRKKNLGTGFASATSVAESREGDCSEHAVLLAALLRARGIPARVASGLIYADQFAGSEGIFGYHMWTQALLESDGAKRWVDLDATLPPEFPYDATHITISVSPLNDDDATTSLAGIATLMGRVAIEVESVEHAP